jgi:hypothetical protein
MSAATTPQSIQEGGNNMLKRIDRPVKPCSRHRVPFGAITRRVGPGLAAAATLAIACASPAWADYWNDSQSTAGAAATCALSTGDGRTVRDQYASITCSRIADTSCDNHSVYVEWWQDGYRKVRATNSAGCNRTLSGSDRRYTRMGRSARCTGASAATSSGGQTTARRP